MSFVERREAFRSVVSSVASYPAVASCVAPVGHHQREASESWQSLGVVVSAVLRRVQVTSEAVRAPAAESRGPRD
jgi:hypothetical protein